MCVICNVGEHVHVARNFLASHERAQEAMRQATVDMAEVAASSPAHTRRYWRIQRRLDRIARDWQKVAQLRDMKPDQ